MLSHATFPKSLSYFIVNTETVNSNGHKRGSGAQTSLSPVVPNRSNPRVDCSTRPTLDGTQRGALTHPRRLLPNGGLGRKWTDIIYVTITSWSLWVRILLRGEVTNLTHNPQPGGPETTPLTYLLTYGAEPFLRSRQLCSHSRTSQHFMESEGSSPCSQEPSTGPYPERDGPSPHHPILFL
jgi:hypothetical protein